MYTITFFGKNNDADVVVPTVDDVRAIIESGANVMVEWEIDGVKEWGDAVDGHACTDTLAALVGA